MTWAKRLFIGATSVLVVLAAVPGFLLGTETGLQIIKGALEKAVPGLRIESLSGSVFSLKADNLQYDVPGLAFHGNLSCKTLQPSFVTMTKSSIRTPNLPGK